MEKRFVAPLTEPEQQTLTSAYHHGEKRALRRRAHAILLSDQGHTINQISEILQVRRDAVCVEPYRQALGSHCLLPQPKAKRAGILKPSRQTGLSHDNRDSDHGNGHRSV